MKNRTEIEQVLKRHRKELEIEFGVKELGLFGSYVRNEQNGKSDVDILAEFEHPISLFRFIDLKERLSQLLNAGLTLSPRKVLNLLSDVRFFQK